MDKNILLQPTKKSELTEFKKVLKESFEVAVIKEFGECNVISDEEIEKSFNALGAEIYNIIYSEQKVGGVVLNINNETQNNSIELFYLYPKYHNLGIGQDIWKTIEEKYPKTKVWKLVTPYFEKRNINFYVNKCGFHIVEFINKYHKGKNKHNKVNDNEKISWKDEFFVFEKVMKS